MVRILVNCSNCCILGANRKWVWTVGRMFLLGVDFFNVAVTAKHQVTLSLA